MENLRDFLNMPNLAVNDAKEMYELSNYIADKRARRILGHGRLIGTLSNEKLRNISLLELIDACDLIRNSHLKEIFENCANQNAKRIVSTEQKVCFICQANIRYFSMSTATLYDDHSGIIYFNIIYNNYFFVNYV